MDSNLQTEWGVHHPGGTITGGRTSADEAFNDAAECDGGGGCFRPDCRTTGHGVVMRLAAPWSNPTFATETPSADRPPTAWDILGIDPGHTGDLSTDEFVRNTRRGGRETNPGDDDGSAVSAYPPDAEAPISDAEQLRYINELFRILRDVDFGGDDLLWGFFPDGRLAFSLICSDTFWWGTADCEPVDPDDLTLLRQCAADLAAADTVGTIWLSTLYAARKRGLRPMNRWMRDQQADGSLREGVVALLEACSPQRDSTMMAP
jgi:hypothetical protein